MRHKEEFIQVVGEADGKVGEIALMEISGEEYVITKVQQVTEVSLRKATPAECLQTSHRIMIMDDDLHLVYVQSDIRSRGLGLSLAQMEREKLKRERREKREKRRAEAHAHIERGRGTSGRDGL